MEIAMRDYPMSRVPALGLFHTHRFSRDRSMRKTSQERFQFIGFRKVAFGKTAMIRIMIALLVLCVSALARDNGQYNSTSPEVRQWFRAQKSPKTGGLCCNEADGTYAEEDIRDGLYWT